MRSIHTALAATAVLLAACAWPSAPASAQSTVCVPGAVAARPDTTPVPAVIAASGGTLNARFLIVPDSVRVNGCRYGRNLYAVNGGRPTFLPPALRLSPGDSLNLSVTNRMTTDTAVVDTIYHSTRTNFHFHGFNVTPDTSTRGPNVGDQVVTVHYDSGAAPHTYAFRLPKDHPRGMHWYHPHPHGNSDEQVASGMSGAILVGDVRTRLVGGETMPEKVLVIRDFQPNGPNASGGSIFTINGDVPARFTIPANGRQLWHLGNLGSDTFLGVALVNGRDSLAFIVLSQDGNELIRPDIVKSLVLSPAARFDVVVEAPSTPGVTYTLVNTFASSAVNGKVGSLLGTLTTTAAVPRAPMTILRDTSVERRRDALLALTPDTARRFTFVTHQPAPNVEVFWIDSVAYDSSRIDVMVPLGNVEDWTLVNQDAPGTLPHVFHIHQGDFLVTRLNGKALPVPGFQDRLRFDGGDSVTVRIPFTEGFQEGLYVFHCHILFHEDNGMMQNLCVYPKDEKDPAGWCQRQLDHQTSAHH